MRNRIATLSLAVMLCGPFAYFAFAATQDDVALGERLATLLRAGRSVISNHQDLFNDPSLGDKGFDGDRMVEEATALFAERRGEEPVSGDLSDRDRRLIEAQIAAMDEVVDEHKSQIDIEGMGFKGFIPALFGRLVNERFAEKVGDEARIKVTAPIELVRNRNARPDDWETAVIETRFRAPDWPRGEAYTEEVDVDGRPAFRMLLPEYYSSSCLSCHGGPAGELDITGYPKEGAGEGDLAGAISIILYR